MALYNDKGLEELKGKLEAFHETYKNKTGSLLSRDELKLIINTMYENKKRRIIDEAFGDETPKTLKTLIAHFDELMPDIVPRGTFSYEGRIMVNEHTTVIEPSLTLENKGEDPLPDYKAAGFFKKKKR